MYCLKTAHSVEDIVNKSRFIGLAMPCEEESGVAEFLKELHGRYTDASHIVYAYRLKRQQTIVYRFHDAGEPTGTAGKPIFQQIEGRHLINLCIAVVRYFGGVKLGTGGLTRAYANTARHVIENAPIVPYIEWAQRSLTLDYSKIQNLEYVLSKLNGRIIHKDFSEYVKVVVELPIDRINKLAATFDL
jgi:uncharacterized YigZ family protein